MPAGWVPATAGGVEEISNYTPGGVGGASAKKGNTEPPLPTTVPAACAGESGGVEEVVRRPPNEAERFRLCTRGIYRTVDLVRHVPK